MAGAAHGPSPGEGWAALAQYGFVLAGGYVFHLHRITSRLSQDVDLFTDRFDPELFTIVQARVDAGRRQVPRGTSRDSDHLVSLRRVASSNIDDRDHIVQPGEVVWIAGQQRKSVRSSD